MKMGSGRGYIYPTFTLFGYLSPFLPSWMDVNDCNDYAMLCYAMMKIYMWNCWSGLVCLHCIACVRG